MTSIKSGSGQSGDMRTARQLDRETQGGEFQMTVIAVQREGEMNKTCEVGLNLEDVNDSSPVFWDISTIRFSEDTKPGVAFTPVRVFHPEVNPALI